MRSPGTWSPELLRRVKGTKRRPNRVCTVMEYQEPESERLKPGKCTKPKVRFRQFPYRATWSLSCVDWESTHPERGHTQCGPDTASAPHTRQWYLFAVFLPPHSMTEHVSLNKWPPLPPCVRAETRHWRDVQTEEAKINRGNLFGSDTCNRLNPVLGTNYMGRDL